MMSAASKRACCSICKNSISASSEEPITRHKSDLYHSRCFCCTSCKVQLSGSFAFRKAERLCLDCASRRTFSAKSLNALFSDTKDNNEPMLSPRSRNQNRAAAAAGGGGGVNSYWENPPTAIPDSSASDLLRSTAVGILAVQQRRATEVAHVWRGQNGSGIGGNNVNRTDDLEVMSYAPDTKGIPRAAAANASGGKLMLTNSSSSIAGASSSSLTARSALNSATSTSNWHPPQSTQSLPIASNHAVLRSSNETMAISADLSVSPPALSSSSVSHSRSSPATSPPASPRTAAQGNISNIGIGKSRAHLAASSPSPSGSWVSAPAGGTNSNSGSGIGSASTSVTQRSPAILAARVVGMPSSATSPAVSPIHDRPSALGSRSPLAGAKLPPPTSVSANPGQSTMPSSSVDSESALALRRSPSGSPGLDRHTNSNSGTSNSSNSASGSTPGAFLRVYIDSTNSLVQLNEKDDYPFRDDTEPRTVGDLLHLLESYPIFSGRTLVAYTARQQAIASGTLPASTATFVRVEKSILSLSTGNIPGPLTLLVQSVNSTSPSISPASKSRVPSPLAQNLPPPPAAITAAQLESLRSSPMRSVVTSGSSPGSLLHAPKPLPLAPDNKPRIGSPPVGSSQTPTIPSININTSGDRSPRVVLSRSKTTSPANGMDPIAPVVFPPPPPNQAPQQPH